MFCMFSQLEACGFLPAIKPGPFQYQQPWLGDDTRADFAALQLMAHALKQICVSSTSESVYNIPHQLNDMRVCSKLQHGRSHPKMRSGLETKLRTRHLTQTNSLNYSYQQKPATCSLTPDFKLDATHCNPEGIPSRQHVISALTLITTGCSSPRTFDSSHL